MNRLGLRMMMGMALVAVLIASLFLFVGANKAAANPDTPVSEATPATPVSEAAPKSGRSSIPSYMQDHIPSPAEVGNGLYSFLFMDIYNARLIAPHGEYDANKPFALSLTYLRSFKGSAIAKESVKQMRGQGFDDTIKSAAWYTLMNDIFPNVHAGDTITGIATADKKTAFFLNGEEIGTINDPEFTDRFFGIWLSSDTSAPQLRSELLATR